MDEWEEARDKTRPASFPPILMLKLTFAVLEQTRLDGDARYLFIFGLKDASTIYISRREGRPCDVIVICSLRQGNATTLEWLETFEYAARY